jgi:hypothetical protein
MQNSKNSQKSEREKSSYFADDRRQNSFFKFVQAGKGDMVASIIERNKV